MAQGPKTEVELAKVVVAYLEGEGWEVFQEIHSGECTIDIVARKGETTWCVETKTTLNLELLSQVDHHYRVKAAHLISIAVPAAKLSNGRYFAKSLLRERGIGFFEVVYSMLKEPYLVDRLSARPQEVKPKPHQALSKLLVPEAKHFAEAGNNLGLFFSPYKRTVSNIKTFLGEHPGATLEEIVAGVSHHYKSKSSAKTSLKDTLVRVESGWCEARLVEGTTRYFVREVPNG